MLRFLAGWLYLSWAVLLHAALPAAFEPNRGQADFRFLYLARSADHTIYLSRSEAVLVAPGAAPVAIRFEQGRADARIEPAGPLPGVSNYFIGRDPKNWRMGIPQFRSVSYRELYPGIDLIFHGDEFDFDIAPHADPRAIRLRLEGGRAEITPEGDIAIAGVRLHRPVIYQGATIIPGRFQLDCNGLLTFAVAFYDHGRKLTIDPVIAWSAYLGNGNTSRFASVVVDKDGNSYLTGRAISGFPTVNSLQTNHGGFCGEVFVFEIPCGDVFVTKLNAAGTALVYSTYIGGSSEDAGIQIGVDATGNAYVLGTTQSTDFPSTDGAYQPVSKGPGISAFVFKLDPAGGKLIYSTGVDGLPNAFAIDAAGNAYIASENRSVSAGVVAIDKLNPQGTALVYDFTFGGSGEDAPRSIAVDGAGAAYVAGITHSSDFPVTPGALQSTNTAYANFIAKVNPAGDGLAFATYFAGGINAIAPGPGGDVFISGIVVDGFQTTPKAAQSVYGGSLGDAFAARIDASGSKLLYATYIGGDGYDIGQGMAVDAAGNAIIVGSTGSRNFPLAANTQRIPQGGAEAFITKLDPTGSKFLFSTFLGGFGNDEATAVAVDGQGNLYVAGNSEAQGFPVTPQSPYTPPPANRTFSSLNSTVVSGAFILKLSDSGPSTPVVFSDGITSIAGFDFGPVTPGQIVDLIGSNLGPLNSVVLMFDANGRVSHTLAGIEVDFDGVPAPLVFVTIDDIRAVVPFSVAGKSSVQVVVKTPAGVSPPVMRPVAPAAPGLFTLGTSPSIPQGAIVNQDGTINSAQNPASRGSIVSLYGAGFGPTDPPLEDGRVYTANFPTVALPTTVEIGEVAAEVLYAGQAYGLVAGVILINARISLQAATGSNQLVFVKAGPYTTPRPVQIAIR